MKLYQIPVNIARKYKNVHMGIDIFFVNGNTFLHTKSTNIGYRSVQELKSRRVTDILSGIKVITKNTKYQDF